MPEDTPITQTRICIQQTPKHEQDAINQKRLKGSSDMHIQKLSAAFNASKIWPAGTTINIAFLEDGENVPRTPINPVYTDTGRKVDPDPLSLITAHMKTKDAVQKIVTDRIAPLVNLKFNFVTNPSEAQVRISFEPNGGAWSLVGTDCLQETDGATMNLGWFDVATVMHEFGHTLGMIHEHQNPHDNPILWNEEKVFQWARETQGWSSETTRENIIDTPNYGINGSQFDPLSIMLYFFPADLTTNNKGTHQNLRLSGLDAEWIAKMYPKTDEDPDETADDFYQLTYGESLQDAIEKSETEALGSKNGKINWLLIIIILAFILIMAIIIIKNR